jgi:HK97 gp10 family phage protein
MTVENLDKFNKQMTVDVPMSVHDALKAEIERQSSLLTQRISGLTPVDRGVLKATVKWEWAKPKDNSPLGLRTRVTAGDSTTIVSNRRGKRWQLARLVEFGTVHRKATPFFFPVYRAYKKKMRSALSTATRKAIKAWTLPPPDLGNAA